MTQIHGDHPTLITGRRHARDVIESGARVVRAHRMTKTADAREALAAALQLVMSAALVDGYEPQEAYEALAGTLAWAVLRLSPEVRVGVLTEMVRVAMRQVMAAAPNVN